MCEHLPESSIQCTSPAAAVRSTHRIQAECTGAAPVMLTGDPTFHDLDPNDLQILTANIPLNIESRALNQPLKEGNFVKNMTLVLDFS